MYCGFLPARHLVVWAPAFSFLYTPSLSLRFLPFRFGSEQPLAASCSHLGPPALSSQLKPLCLHGTERYEEFSTEWRRRISRFFPWSAVGVGRFHEFSGQMLLPRIKASGSKRLLKIAQVAASGCEWSLFLKLKSASPACSTGIVV